MTRSLTMCIQNKVVALQYIIKIHIRARTYKIWTLLFYWCRKYPLHAAILFEFSFNFCTKLHFRPPFIFKSAVLKAGFASKMGFLATTTECLQSDSLTLLAEFSNSDYK